MLPELAAVQRSFFPRSRGSFNLVSPSLNRCRWETVLLPRKKKEQYTVLSMAASYSNLIVLLSNGKVYAAGSATQGRVSE